MLYKWWSALPLGKMRKYDMFKVWEENDPDSSPHYPNCKYSAPWCGLGIKYASSQLVQKLEFSVFGGVPGVQGFWARSLKMALMTNTYIQNLLFTQITTL